MKTAFVSFCFLLVAASFCSLGFLMLIKPANYVALANWYLEKVGFKWTLSLEKYSRPQYRIAGLVLLIAGLASIIFYIYVIKDH